MSSRRHLRHLVPLARLAVVAAGFALTLWLVGWLLRGPVTETPAPIDPEVAAAYAAARDPSFGPEQEISLHVDRLVEPTGEAPVLRELVEAGQLPPLRERMPRRPAVLRGVEGIGTYGGTWMRLANAAEDVSIINNRLSGAYLARWSPMGYPIVPHIAESITSSDEDRVWTIKLREGMRWSDGDPYDVDDIMYWWTADINNPHTTMIAPAFMRNAGKTGRIEPIDRYTFRAVFEDPYPTFGDVLPRAGDFTNIPSHYLRPYHPDPAIGDRALIEDKMRRYKLPSPSAVYGFVKAWNNPEHPRLWPWVYRTFSANPPHTFVRNPYYFVVDEAGNQLPYIDRLQFDVVDGKMLALRAANGGVSMQTRHIRFADYTELMSRREIANTRVLHWYPGSRSTFVINPNLNRRVNPAEPQTRWKAELLGDKRFRQALSLALDRWAVIKAEQTGLGEPAQVSPGPQSRFPAPQLSNAFIDHDPARANALLDELGLTQRDDDGMRTFPDGSRMTFFLDFSAFTGAGPGQFIVDDWEAVGVRTIARERARPLFYTEKDAMDFDFNVWSGESDIVPLVLGRFLVPFNTESFYAVGWARWFDTGGFYGTEVSRTLRGSIPVPVDHPMYAAIEAYERARLTTDEDAQRAALNIVYDIAAENVWTISIATPPPVPVVVDQNLRNVPENAMFGVVFLTPANAGMETYFFTENRDSPGAIAEVKRSVRDVTPRPAADGSQTPMVNRLLRWLPVLIAGAFLLMVGLRHPFVWHRLVIMVPTLLIISVVTFTVIQLPPGDYLTARIILLEESGDEANLRAIDDLKEVFHFEDPAWLKYLRWMGVPWFLSFDSADTGLLQGNLGRSMETMTPINQLVGDRLALTMAITIGTILMTWAIALPIGIYSAVRQYSLADYALTIVGFLGMCTPAFLLALVLMAVSGFSGLFSPEYAAQPEWTFGKFVDLLKHIWIPIVVLGVGGTAGMIRIMRANLLDELRKPYVTTARAKGVRPLKLLIKYPVRLALNPFVSGIGHLFPQIVSGGAIVAMVLALPTIGPLLLSALFTEDMYLAGSMLMVLSLLGVFGTLVSDLLLLWLDPRIRFQGGTR
jgi:ABC-type dipeptide/oligopeptide/nickel transport system permease component/ABC-type transport system substrate-binding protein